MKKIGTAKVTSSRGVSLPGLVVRPKKKHKYRATPTVIDGIRFDSEGEAQRWQELKLLEAGGKISSLARQLSYPLHSPDGASLGYRVDWRVMISSRHVEVCRIVIDFSYIENGIHILEDFKSPATMTPLWKLKRKMFEAQYGKKIRITQSK